MSEKEFINEFYRKRRVALEKDASSIFLFNRIIIKVSETSTCIFLDVSEEKNKPIIETAKPLNILELENIFSEEYNLESMTMYEVNKVKCGNIVFEK